MKGAAVRHTISKPEWSPEYECTIRVVLEDEAENYHFIRIVVPEKSCIEINHAGRQNALVLAKRIVAALSQDPEAPSGT